MSSPAIVALTQAVLDEWRAAGVVVTAYEGNPRYVPVILDLTLSSQNNLETVRRNVIHALVRYSLNLKPGETMAFGDLLGTIRGVSGVIPLLSTVVSPPGDVVPATSDEVLRIRRTDVSFS
jgi:hypothetical protein